MLLAKLKQRLIWLISEYVQLRPVGKNLKALCPFHQEKVPSFYVSPERQIWHCFGQCNDGGDIFKFLMKMENVDFPEALRILAQKAGVELRSGDYHFMSQRTKLLDIMRLTAKFYHKILLESPPALKARQYLKKRKLQEKTIKEFQLGFAPATWDTLFKFLTKRGFNQEDIELAGLIIKSDKQQTTSGIQYPTSSIRYYDRFRNRLLFPLNDAYGNTVGFTGRIMPEAENEEIAKYINTPETPIYNKSRLLYALDKAKEAIKEQQFVILVEGNIDAIACHQAGTKNVVAVSGTALTLEQVKNLKRYTNNLVLAFDLDLAGERATQRGIDVALEQEMNVKILRLPKGKDPDEYIRENPKKWLRVIKTAQPIMEYFFDLAFRGRKKESLEDKKIITNLLLPQIAKLGSPIERDHWLKILGERLAVPEFVLRESLSRIKSSEIRPETAVFPQAKPGLEQLVAERLISLVLRFPQIGIKYFLTLTSEIFTGKQLMIAKSIFNCYQAEKLVDLQKIQEAVADNQEMLGYLDFLILLAEKEFSEIDKREIEKEAIRLSKKLKYWWLNNKLTEAVRILKEVEEQGNRERVEETVQEIRQIIKALGELK